jgi:enoyl-CoA hydratase/carnithine racemase
VVPDAQLDAEVDRLAAELASKSAHVLRVTLAQVEGASPSLPPSDGGAEADVRGFAEAFADPESRSIAAAYRRRR